MNKVLILITSLIILIAGCQTGGATTHQATKAHSNEKVSASEGNGASITTDIASSLQVASVKSQQDSPPEKSAIIEENDQQTENTNIPLAAAEVNERILPGKGSLAGQAEAFLRAAELTDIDVMYLISHATLETNHGTSPLAAGVKVKVLKNKAGNEVEVFVLEQTATNYDAIVYNMYGVNTHGSHPFLQGAKFAYFQGWTTPEKAILGGAEAISVNYVQSGQHKLYRKKDNPEAIKRLGYIDYHYTTDSDWARKQKNEIARLYGLLK